MDAISPLLIAKALDGLHARYQATAENIANANTPGYRPVQVTFEARLQAAARQGAEAITGVSPRTEMASISNITGGMRLDLEVATAAQTAMRYAALLDILGREMAISRAVVRGGN
jgi:flagellar basal-body rod protein FlgB